MQQQRSLSRGALVSALICIILAAALLRFRQLESIPPGFHFDESFEGLEAWQILTDPSYRPIFLFGNFGVPVAFAYLTAAMFWLFSLFDLPVGPLAMRTVAAISGILTIPPLIGAARELAFLGLVRREAAWLVALTSAGTLAGLRWHIHFSRMGIEPILGPLLWAFSLWMLLWAWRVAPTAPARGYLGFLLCGAGLAGAMYTYQAIWFLPVIIALCALVLLLHIRIASGFGIDWRDPRFRGLLSAGIFSMLLVSPLAVLFIQQPDLMFTRPTQVIAGEGNQQQSLWESTIATASMFAPFGAGDLDPRRNLPGEPALNWLWGAAFFLGALVGLRYFYRPAWLLLWIGWLGLLFPGIITEYAPHFHRILAAAGPTAIFIGVGLWYMGRGLQQLFGFILNHTLSPVWSLILVAPIILGAAAWDAHDYFNRWSTRPDLYHAFDEGLWQIGLWSSQQDAHLFISPRGEEHTTLAFAWRALPLSTTADEVTAADPVPGHPVRYDGRQVFPIELEPQRDSIYIAIEHEDFRSPLLLPEVFPDAEIVHQFFDGNGELYATAYARAADQSPRRVPTHPVEGRLGDSIRLLGYDLLPTTLSPGDVAYLQLHWQTASPPAQDLTVFIHLVDSQSGELVAGHDAQPGQGSLTTDRWQAPWLILDEHQLHLDPGLEPGSYTLRVGLYPTGSPHEPIGPPLELGQISVEEP